MLSRRIRVQVGIFVLIGLLATSFIGVRYVGLLRYFGATGYSMQVQLPDSGGLFDNAEVTYRGVPVGRVGAMRLTATGISVKLTISSSSTHIPANVTANVADLSVIGEQYLNLVPKSDGGPYLHSGSVIPVADTTVPVTANQLLQSSDTLLDSVPIGSLQTTVSELSAAFQNSSPDLQRLLDSADSFFTAAKENFPATTTLLDTSVTVLATQEATSSSIQSFSNDLALIAANLKGSDADLRTLIQVTPGAATQLDDLFGGLSEPLTVLLANLTTTSQVFSANVGGLQALLVRAPQAISIGNKVVTAAGANVGLGLTFFDPLPCTSGYAGTVRRSPLDLSQGTGLNTSAGCRPTSSASEVRGARELLSGNATGALTTWAPSALTVPAPGATATSLSDLLGGQG